ncbi:MAG: hypothetical protein R3C53_19640 [Pirellulaceae bacterium]
MNGKHAPTDASTLEKILSAMQCLTRAIDGLRADNAAIQSQLDSLVQQFAAASSAAAAKTVGARETPAFISSFCEYEVGELFDDAPAFDLSVRFKDELSYEWYRVWRFADRGQALHALLESCARTRLASTASELTYRRDEHSVTIYARQPDVLAELWNAFEAANATFDGAMRLMETAATLVHEL